MKWKEFFTATLPRSRKSRKKSNKNQCSAEQSGSASSPETDDVIIRNQNVRTDAINGNRKRPSSRSTGALNIHSTQISHNKSLVSSDFQYLTDSNKNRFSKTYEHNTLSKTHSNASESGFEDAHDHYVGPYDSFDSTHSCSAVCFQQTLQPDILVNSYNTFPRERTRIKTNPWISSPTNSTIMTSSVHENSPEATTMPRTASVSPYHTDTNSGRVGFMDYNKNQSNSNCENIPEPNGNNDCYFSQSADTSEMPFFTHDSSPDPTEHNTFDSSQAGVVEGGDLVINLKTGDIFVKPKPDFSPVSFQYEEDLDATLERDSGRRKAKSRKARGDTHSYLSKKDLQTAWDAGRSRTVGHSGAAMDYLDDDSEKEVSDSDKEDTLTKQRVARWRYETRDSGSFRKRGLKHRTHGRGFLLPVDKSEADKGPRHTYRNIYYSDMDKGQVKDDRNCYHDNREIMYDPYHQREASDSAYDSSTLSSLAGSSFHGPLSSLERYEGVDQYRPTTLPGVKSRCLQQTTSNNETRRSLEEIRESLRDKVVRLKAEKRIVDEKVKQARQEEELRKEEKSRIQKEVLSLRKHVLLHTLQELKENLDDQSLRLQDAYDDVMDMQWVNSKLRRARNTSM